MEACGFKPGMTCDLPTGKVPLYAGVAYGRERKPAHIARIFGKLHGSTGRSARM
jgi:hypothetical protein